MTILQNDLIGGVDETTVARADTKPDDTAAHPASVTGDVTPKQPLPGKGTARGGCAYLILAHHLPRQVLGLAEAITRGSARAEVFIHVDRKAGELLDAATLPPRTRLVPDPVAVTWGEWSQVEAVLRSLAFIRTMMDFDWLVVLSGQDYPLRPIAEFEAFLAGSGRDAFVKATPIDELPYRFHSVSRYFYRHMRVPTWVNHHRLPAALRRAIRVVLKLFLERNGLVSYLWLPRGHPGLIGVRVVKHPFGPGFGCWQGSDWLNLNRRAVDYFLDVLRRDAGLERHFQRTAIPSEALYQTVICNARALRVELDDLRYVNWRHARDPHPLTLTIDDLDAMRKSTAFFARKFDERVDALILERLASLAAPPAATSAAAPTTTPTARPAAQEG